MFDSFVFAFLAFKELASQTDSTRNDCRGLETCVFVFYLRELLEAVCASKIQALHGFHYMDTNYNGSKCWLSEPFG